MKIVDRLPLLDGEVQVDGSTPGVRRTLSVALAREFDLWDTLAPIGTELRAYVTLHYPGGTSETVPQGVFDVDVQRMSYAPGGTLQITAPDRWVRVQRARFLTPRVSTPGATIAEQIEELLLEALPAGTLVDNQSTDTSLVPAQVWDRDRDKAIEELARAGSLDVYLDREGNAVIRDAPTLQAEEVWEVNAGDTGVLVAADRERNRQRTYNLVVVNSDRNDEAEAFSVRYVWDGDPDSPTYAGPDPVNNPSAAGPFGVRPFFYSSALLNSPDQALQAGDTILARVTGLAAQITLDSVPNPALDDGDTIRVTFPRERRDRVAASERHIVDSFNVPLRPAGQGTGTGAPQRIATRSTVADLPGES